MLIYVKIIKIILKNFIGRTDGQTHGLLKTIVRNLTKFFFFFENLKIFLDTLIFFDT